ncbi:hypothetical protein [Bacterioplanoides pacificum]|uniref:HTH crp-type domain-containing protein n=1 Tax=Bacterioplanoides pacificum TaxID=1171596 RepID=A0ABV7VV13_9GAMM
MSDKSTFLLYKNPADLFGKGSFGQVAFDLETGVNFSPYVVDQSDVNTHYSLLEGEEGLIIDGQVVQGLPVYTRYTKGRYQCCQRVPHVGDIYWEPSLISAQSGGHTVWDPSSFSPLDSEHFGKWSEFGNWVPKYKMERLRDLLLHRTIVGLAGNLKYVLIVLDGMADYRGHVANTTFRQIGDLTGYGKDTVNKHLDELKRLKVIKELSRTRRKQKGMHQETLPREYEILIGYQTVEWKDQNFSLVSTNY